MKVKPKKIKAGNFAASVDLALKRAARTARKTARMYGTRLYFWEGGKIVSQRP